MSTDRGDRRDGEQTTVTVTFHAMLMLDLRFRTVDDPTTGATPKLRHDGG